MMTTLSSSHLITPRRERPTLPSLCRVTHTFSPHISHLSSLRREGLSRSVGSCKGNYNPAEPLTTTMASFLSSLGEVGAGGGESRRQHPLLLWLDAAGYEGRGSPLLMRYYWLSLGAYYLLLFACGWFVLQWFRRGRPWARARSFLVGKSKGEEGGAAGAGVGVGGYAKKATHKAPQLRYVDSVRNRRLLSRTTVLRQPYVPSPWLGHRVRGERCT